jgi:transcriptional regulator with XRE-family HTH domain
MSKVINKFKEQFAACRKRSGLTYRTMETMTGIKYSALAAMQGGNRPVGEQSARRIAQAFGLAGNAREAFVLAALNTSKEKVLAAVDAYPSEVLNLLGLLLMANGIKPSHISRCGYDPAAPDCLTLSLKRGRTVHLHVTLSDGRIGKGLHHRG